MNNLGNIVQVSFVGEIRGLERLEDGRIKYEVKGDNWAHAFVYEEDIITIHQEEPDAVTANN